MPDVSAPSIKDRVAEIGFWWHSIDLGNGIVTPGHKGSGQLAHEVELMKLPDLRGKSVIDIGAWDGFFSFEAERRGASRVVAMDYHAWHSDMDTLFKHRADGGGDESQLKIWHDDALPGKRAFDLAASALNSKVESIDADFMTTDLSKVGTFDVTLFLGVLYHMKHPLVALEKIASLTKEVAIIETEAIVIPGYEKAVFCEFYETDELNKDASNWWAPTMPALLGMLRAAGFRKVEAANHAPPTAKLDRLKSALGDAKPIHYRAFAHAWK
ncbi:MAG TPA: DUF1698 domain-containing protein [Planktothrix sp.]|jgi:tRNA (mo5U34)-methyltransferase